MQIRSLLRSSVSWFFLVVGLLLGLIALTRFGNIPFPLTNLHPDWCLRWFSFFGLGFFGIAYTAASIAAFRNRKSAGQIFLALLPVVAIGLAYPESTIALPEKQGWVQWASPQVAIGLSVLFYLPFATVFIFPRNRFWFFVSFFLSTCIASFVFLRSEWTWGLIPKLIEFSAICGIPAAFWLGTHKLGWPPLLQARRLTVRQRLRLVSLQCLALLFLIVVVTTGLEIWFSSPINSYKGKSPFSKPTSRYHAVFIAKTVFTGRKHLLFNRWMSSWAIARVEETFWTPSWTPRWVLLTDWYFEDGQRYFVDGEHEHGLVTRFLPIISTGASRTRLVNEASVDLRILREPKASHGAQVIGFIARPPESGRPNVPFEGVQISAESEREVRTTTSDKDGIYEFKDLPEGEYFLRLTFPDNQLADLIDVAGPREKIHLAAQDIREVRFYLYWNGRIEGSVRDDQGSPANVSLLLLTPDGNRVTGPGRDFVFTNKDGVFRLDRIPPGNYILLLNSFGPSKDSPFNVQYHPAALQPNGAQVLHLTEGQLIKGIDFKVSRLAQRSVRVRVSWPDGRSVADASVCDAYEHTEEFEKKAGSRCEWRTDTNGVAIVPIYGYSKVRLFAYQWVDNEKKKWGDTYYSHSVEINGNDLPDNLSLVLNSDKP